MVGQACRGAGRDTLPPIRRPQLGILAVREAGSLDTIRREKMDFADRADIATRLCAEEIPHDVADHAGYIADEVNLLAAQRTYELRR